MATSPLFVILNPAAGRGRAHRAWPGIEAVLRQGGADFRLAVTERRGHAAELAESAAREGWPAVVAVGGDGAVHEVANGLMRSGRADRVAMGIVGVGTGNDFIKMVGIPRPPLAAARHLLASAPRRVDLGRVTRCVAAEAPAGEWYFTNGIGVGFDAQVGMEASGVRRLRGAAVYGLALLRTLRALRAPRVRVVVDGRVVADRPLLLATLGNGACHGGSFWLCPEARIDDGMLDILVADARGVPEVVSLVPRVLGGRHLGARGVELHRGRTAELRSDDPLPIHADGEIVAREVREIAVEVMPGALAVLGWSGVPSE